MIVPNAMKRDLMRLEEEQRARSVRYAWHRAPRPRRTLLPVNRVTNAVRRILSRRSAGRPVSARAARMVSPAEPP